MPRPTCAGAAHRGPWPRNGWARTTASRKAVRAGAGLSYLLFVPKTSGYELREEEGEPPAPGAEIAVNGETMQVAKVAPSPLPGDRRQCAFLLQD